MIMDLMFDDVITKASSPEEYCLPRPDNEREELQIVREHTVFDLTVNKKFTRKTARGALRVFHHMACGESLGRVVSQSRNSNSVAIGMMLYSGYRKELIDHNISPESLMAAIVKQDIEEEHPTVFNRHRAIRHLKKLGLVSGSQIDRQIRPSGTAPTIRMVGKLIAHAYGYKYSMEDICSSSRGKRIVAARFRTIWILRHVCGHSLSAIGQYMGNRDHTTILNSINKLNIDYIKDENGFAAEIDSLCERADMMGVIQSRNTLIRSLSRQS